jgi:GT2 family glycosyltransferase
MFSGKLAVIINSYNRLSLLSIALPALELTLLNTPVDSCVVIFEAGSTDGSSEFIEKFKLNSKLNILCITPPKDLPDSFASGCNYAIQYAAERFKNLKWCFFYETDNFISNHNALTSALKLMEANHDIAAIGFTVEKVDGLKVGYGQRFPNLFSFIIGQHASHGLRILEPRPKWNSEPECRWSYCDIVYTSPLLVNYSVWKKTGGMDSENFPFSDSDNDWCWRLKKLGLKCAVIDLPGVVHDNRNQASSWSANRTLNFHQARYSLLRKHKGKIVHTIKPLLALRHITELMLLSGALLVGKKDSAKLSARVMLIKGVMDNYTKKV